MFLDAKRVFQGVDGVADMGQPFDLSAWCCAAGVKLQRVRRVQGTSPVGSTGLDVCLLFVRGGCVGVVLLGAPADFALDVQLVGGAGDFEHAVNVGGHVGEPEGGADAVELVSELEEHAEAG